MILKIILYVLSIIAGIAFSFISFTPKDRTKKAFIICYALFFLAVIAHFFSFLLLYRLISYGACTLIITTFVSIIVRLILSTEKTIDGFYSQLIRGQVVKNIVLKEDKKMKHETKKAIRSLILGMNKEKQMKKLITVCRKHQKINPS